MTITSTLSFLSESSGPLLQPTGSRSEAAARTRPKAARAPLQPRRLTRLRPRPPLPVQSFAGLLRACRGESGAGRRTHSAPPSPPERPRARHSFRPARPYPARRRRRRARARARRRADSPSERPRPACALRAGGLRLFEQEGGHISPSRPPSPHPPQAFATATRPLRSRGRSPSQKLPHQAAPGPDSRLPHRELSSLPLLSLHRAPTSPCPAGHRGSSPSSDGQNGRVRLSRRDHLLAESDRCVGAAPSKAGDAGLDRLQHFRVERAGPVAQAAAAAGTAPHPPFVFAFPLLPPLLPKGVSTLLLFLSPLRPISGRGTLHGEGGWGPLS